MSGYYDIFSKDFVFTCSNVGGSGSQGSQGAAGPQGTAGSQGRQGVQGTVGIPGGSTDDLQWNNGGVLAGGGPTWNGTTLAVPGNLSVSPTNSSLSIVAFADFGGNPQFAVTNAGVTITYTNPYFTSYVGKPSYALDSIGSDYGVIQTDGSNLWSLAHSAAYSSLGTPVIQWGFPSGVPSIGFYGATAVAKQTGDVSTALTNLGLISAPTVSVAGTRVSSASGAFDLSTGNWFYRTLGSSNTTLSLSNVQALQDFTIELIQDATGGRIPSWFGGITWMTPSGIVPSIALGAACTTILRFKQIASSTYLGWLVSSQMDYASTILQTAGLVSYWKLGEASGTSAADSKGTNTGTYTGGFTLGTFCSPTLGNGVTFDGSTGYITVPTTSNISPTATISVEMWTAQPTSAGGTYNRILSKTDYEIMANPSAGINSYAWQASIGGSFRETEPVMYPLPGQWYHIVGVYDGANFKTYLNGYLIANIAETGVIGATGTTLNIGRKPDNSHYFTGSVAHVAIYNTGLSQATILNHYNVATKSPGIY